MRVSSCKNCGTSIIWLPRNDGSDRWNPPLNAESAQSGYCIVSGKVEFTYMYSKHTCTEDQIRSYQLILQMRGQRDHEVVEAAKRAAAEAEVIRDNTFRHMDGTAEAIALDAELAGREYEAALAAQERERENKAERERAEYEARMREIEADSRERELRKQEAKKLARKVASAHAEALKENARFDAAKSHADVTPSIQFSDAVPQMQYHKHYGNLPADEIPKVKHQREMNWEDMRQLRRVDALKRDCPTCDQPAGEMCRSMQRHHIKAGTLVLNRDPHKLRISDDWFETEETSNGSR